MLIRGGSASAAYGYYLWGPTIIAMALGVSLAQAADYFIYVAGSGVVGKIIVSIIAPAMGRRTLGIVFGFIATVCLVLAGFLNGVLLGSGPLFIALIAASAFFVEGGFSNLEPYTVEQYGVRLGSRSSGLGQAANGVGKIIGPLALALACRQQQRHCAAGDVPGGVPAFVLFAFLMMLVSLSYLFLGVETHGRPIARGHEELA